MTWFHYSANAGVKVVIDGATERITSGYDSELDNIKSSEDGYLIVDGLTRDTYRPIAAACTA